MQRVYKGEFNITFTAYMPYGIAISKNLEDFNPANKNAKYPRSNFEEWKDSAGLLDLSSTIVDEFHDNSAKIYNAGDVETGFTLTFSIPPTHTTLTLSQTAAIAESNEEKNGYALSWHLLRFCPPLPHADRMTTVSARVAKRS